MALSGASFGTDVWSNNVICGKYDCGHDPSINHLWLNHPSLLPVQRGGKKNPIMHLVTYGLPSLYVCRMWQQENDSACTQTRNSCAEAPSVPPRPPLAPLQQVLCELSSKQSAHTNVFIYWLREAANGSPSWSTHTNIFLRWQQQLHQLLQAWNGCTYSNNMLGRGLMVLVWVHPQCRKTDLNLKINNTQFMKKSTTKI